MKLFFKCFRSYLLAHWAIFGNVAVLGVIELIFVNYRVILGCLFQIGCIRSLIDSYISCLNENASKTDSMYPNSQGQLQKLIPFKNISNLRISKEDRKRFLSIYRI